MRTLVIRIDWLSGRLLSGSAGYPTLLIRMLVIRRLFIRIGWLSGRCLSGSAGYADAGYPDRLVIRTYWLSGRSLSGSAGPFRYICE